MSAFKTLGIKTLTEKEFNVLLGIKNATVRNAMLDALAKQEKAYSNRKALDDALTRAGLM